MPRQLSSKFAATLAGRIDPTVLASSKLIPMKKQKGEKKRPADLTGITNMVVEANRGPNRANYSPQSLTTFTRDGVLLRTLARRVDGCFPATVNPVAIWEIKEYYYTTTFGSRVADGVYETLLDGLELEDLRERDHVHVQHVLIVDAYHCWWDLGRSYFCRMIDLLHMGYVDEILFGEEVVTRLPVIVQGWSKLCASLGPEGSAERQIS